MRNAATNYTFNISSVVGSWYLASTTVGVPIPAEFFEVKVSSGGGSQSVSSGTSGIQSTSGFAAVSNRSCYRLIRVSTTLYRLDVDPLPQLNPDEDEVLTVSLLSAAFTQCPPDGSAALGTILLQSVPDPVAATAQAVAVAASTAAVASSALGAAAALDAQSIAVIAMMSCARPLDRNLMGNVRLLSPLATSSTYEGMIAGNYILFGAVGLLQCFVIAVRRFVSKDSWQMARKFARFPGLLFTAAVVVYQGTSLAAVKLVTMRNSPESTALGVLTLMFFFLLPFGTVFVVYRYVTAEFRQYDFKSFRDGKFAGPVRFIFPFGQWSPPKMTGAYGGLFADIRREGLVWVTLPFWGPTLMVIGAAFRPANLDGCEIQFGTLAALQYLHFVFRVVTWPYRSMQSNVLGSLSALCIALILTGNTVSVKHPTNEGAQTLIMLAVQAQTALTILRIVLAIVSSQLENRLLGGANYTVTARRVGMSKTKKRVKSAEGRLGDYYFFGEGATWGNELSDLSTARPDPVDEPDIHSNLQPLLSYPNIKGGEMEEPLTNLFMDSPPSTSTLLHCPVVECSPTSSIVGSPGAKPADTVETVDKGDGRFLDLTDESQLEPNLPPLPEPSFPPVVSSLADSDPATAAPEPIRQSHFCFEVDSPARSQRLDLATDSALLIFDESTDIGAEVKNPLDTSHGSAHQRVRPELEASHPAWLVDML
jgi:hypothetical protein